MMLLNVVENGDKFMINLFKLSILPTVQQTKKDGNLVLILFLLQYKHLCRDVHSLLKFVKGSFNSHLKEEIISFQNSEVQGLQK